MNSHASSKVSLSVLGLVLLAAASGCNGPIVRTHSRPGGPDYYKNLNPSLATIEVSPEDDLNPVRTQHVLVASVRDQDGKKRCGKRVEWMISEGSVGDFVEVDEGGWFAKRGYKVNNNYAVTYTDCRSHVLTRGTDDPSDDIHLEGGDTWVVITSPVEGTTHVVAYAPEIYNWENHKVFATKQWRDVEWKWPPNATNPVDTPHVLTTAVRQASDGAPLAGYTVTYSIVSGPNAAFEETGGTVAAVPTDAGGMASVTLLQASPMQGINEIEVDIVRPENECCDPAVRIAHGVVTKNWIAGDIRIVKEAPERANVGDTFEYRITVTNPSELAARDVIVQDVLPEGISYVSSSPPAQAQGQALAWSLGTLEARGTSSISVRVTGSTTGRFENCAQVNAAMGLSDRACDDTVLAAPALALEKECPTEVLICETIPYRVIVHNTGDGPATGVTITDQLPAGLVTEDGKRAVAFDAGALAPGEAKEATFSVRAERAGTYNNVVTAKAESGQTAEASCTTIVRQPELTVTKTGPARRFVGRAAKYDIVVANPGDSPARETVLVDIVPNGAEVSNITGGGQLDEGQVRWSLGTIAPGDSRTVSISLTAQQRGVLRNTATATATCTKASDRAETAVEGISAILLEVIDIDDPIAVGEQEVYEITVTNQGSADGTNIRITATLPPEMDYVSADGPTRPTVRGKVVTFAPLPELDPKDTVVYRVVTTGVRAGDVRFGVTLTSDQIKPPPVQETESTHIWSD